MYCDASAGQNPRSLIGHFECLLGCGVRLHRRVVRTDADDREIDLGKRFETFVIGSVAAVEDAAHPGIKQVGVEATVPIIERARAPMIHRSGCGPASPLTHVRSPQASSVTLRKPRSRDEVASLMRLSPRVCVGKPGEARAIKVVEVRVRDQDEIDLRQFTGMDAAEQTARAAGHQPEPDADAIEEDWIGQDRHPTDAQQNGRVAEPRGGQLAVLPIRQIRL